MPNLTSFPVRPTAPTPNGFTLMVRCAHGTTWIRAAGRWAPVPTVLSCACDPNRMPNIHRAGPIGGFLVTFDGREQLRIVGHGMDESEVWSRIAVEPMEITGGPDADGKWPVALTPLKIVR